MAPDGTQDTPAGWKKTTDYATSRRVLMLMNYSSMLKFAAQRGRAIVSISPFGW